MSDIRRDFINSQFGMLISGIARLSDPVEPTPENKVKVITDVMIATQGLGAGTLIDLNRTADALERIADVQEARLKIETAKAQLMPRAMTPPPPPSKIIGATATDGTRIGSGPVGG